jgi:hypothetical protein
MLRLEVKFKYYLKQKKSTRPTNYCFIYIVVLTYFGTFVLFKLETPFPDYIILFSKM